MQAVMAGLLWINLHTVYRRKFPIAARSRPFRRQRAFAGLGCPKPTVTDHPWEVTARNPEVPGWPPPGINVAHQTTRSIRLGLCLDRLNPTGILTRGQQYQQGPIEVFRWTEVWSVACPLLIDDSSPWTPAVARGVRLERVTGPHHYRAPDSTCTDLHNGFPTFPIKAHGV